MYLVIRMDGRASMVEDIPVRMDEWKNGEKRCQCRVSQPSSTRVYQALQCMRTLTLQWIDEWSGDKRCQCRASQPSS